MKNDYSTRQDEIEKILEYQMKQKDTPLHSLFIDAVMNGPTRIKFIWSDDPKQEGDICP